MKKTLAAFVAVATIAGSFAATPLSAQRGVAAPMAASSGRTPRAHRPAVFAYSSETTTGCPVDAFSTNFGLRDPQ